MKRSIAVSDANDDQYLDMIVANYSANNLGLVFEHENGSSNTPITYSRGSNSHLEFVAMYDLYGDNHLDTDVVDSVTVRVYVFPGSNNGIFPLLLTYTADLGLILS